MNWSRITIRLQKKIANVFFALSRPLLIYIMNLKQFLFSNDSIDVEIVPIELRTSK